MIGVYYIILCMAAGFALVRLVFPQLYIINAVRPLFKWKTKIPAFMTVLPASYLIGTISMTWLTYFCCYAFRGTGSAMRHGTLLSLAISSAFCIACAIIWRNKLKKVFSGVHIRFSDISERLKKNRVEFVFIAVVTAFWSFLMFRSFYIAGGVIHTGFSVFSDFCPHLAVIRSFSMGENFPTQYPHFADGTICYHFLFQFLAGTLEFLGLRLDWAFNLPSILSIVSLFALLYAFAVLICGKKAAGILTAVLFTFRSSFAFFTYLAGKSSIGQAFADILTNTVHIGKTQHEDWGLWAQKVYLNQRHLPLAFAVMLVVLMLVYPLFIKMLDALKASRFETEGIIGERKGGIDKLKWKHEFLLCPDAWLPEKWLTPVAAGILLGLLGFWNGAVVIATLPVLFVMALMSKQRLSYLIIAVETLLLVWAESSFFMGRNSGISPMLTIGFLADKATLTGIIAYLIELLGILPILLIAALPALPKGARWLLLAFSTPVVVANLLQLTPDITVNHKYIIMAVMLADIIAAAFLCMLWKAWRGAGAVLASVLVALMTVTGAVDLITVYNLDKSTVTISETDPQLLFVAENTKTDVLFLTDSTYEMGPILLAGRKLFLGWSYFPWSAGYDTNSRLAIVNQIYGAEDAQTVRILCEEYGIDYIVIDHRNRTSTQYTLNQSLFDHNFTQFYKDSDTVIYRVK